MAKEKPKPRVTIEDTGRVLDLSQVSINRLLDAEEVQRLKEHVERSFDMSRYPDPHFYVGEEQIKIIQMEKAGLSLDFGTRKFNDVIKWGSRLSDSDIRLHNSKKIGFYCSTLERCRLIAIQPQEELRWTSMHWVNCRFEGIFNDCVFGAVASNCCFHKLLSQMQRCDFSKARLDACLFINVDVNQQVWPEQPHLIVREPWRHVNVIKAIQPDESLREFLWNLALSTEDVSAKVYSLKWLNVQDWATRKSNLEALLAACRKLDFVTLNC